MNYVADKKKPQTSTRVPPRKELPTASTMSHSKWQRQHRQEFTDKIIENKPQTPNIYISVKQTIDGKNMIIGRQSE